MIIGITAEKHSGKDVIGDYVVSNYDFINYSFANPIKYGCADLFGFTDEQLFGKEKDLVDEFWGVTPRKVFQIIGTEIFQYDLLKHIPELAYVGRSFWFKRFIKWYNSLEIKPNIIITDVRFLHESEPIKQMGGKIWKLTRPSVVRSDDHPSENELNLINNYDEYIVNDSTIQNLHNKVDNLLALYGCSRIES